MFAELAIWPKIMIGMIKINATLHTVALVVGRERC